MVKIECDQGKTTISAEGARGDVVGEMAVTMLAVIEELRKVFASGTSEEMANILTVRLLTDIVTEAFPLKAEAEREGEYVN